MSEYKKVSPKEIVFFIFLLVLCVAGSIGIFWFAVGVESGNTIMKGFMQSLLDHAMGIVGVLIAFNIVLVWWFSKKK